MTKKCICGHDIKHHYLNYTKNGVVCGKDNCTAWDKCSESITRSDWEKYQKSIKEK